MNSSEPTKPPAMVKYSLEAMSALKIWSRANSNTLRRRETAAEGAVGSARSGRKLFS